MKFLHEIPLICHGSHLSSDVFCFCDMCRGNLFTYFNVKASLTVVSY